VIGASFIGLEVAASLRARKLDVHVVGPEARPLERVMGPELGDAVRRLHEKQGVVFHLGQTVTKLAGRTASLSGGTSLTADLIVIGVGVRPSIALARPPASPPTRASPSTNTCRPAPPASTPPATSRAGPIHTAASASASSTGSSRAPGQTAARNILGRRERFDAVPFFWSQHYDMAISMSATPPAGTRRRWKARSPTTTARSTSQQPCSARRRRVGHAMHVPWRCAASRPGG